MLALSSLQATAFQLPGATLRLHASRMPVTCMSDTDDMSQTDPMFTKDELSRTWERTGKGKKRWSPGDETGDLAMDKRLLYSNWVLNPITLAVRDGCSQSVSANLCLGWLKVPFKAADAGEGSMCLTGAGVPNTDQGGLKTFGEITSFAFGICKDASLLSPATDRDDVAQWLAQPSITSFRPLLRGRQPEDGIPCLNAWGLSVDDAKVLPVLRVLLSTTDDKDEGLLDVRDYVDFNFKKAGVEL
jgi:hypothetical protein